MCGGKERGIVEGIDSKAEAPTDTAVEGGWRWGTLRLVGASTCTLQWLATSSLPLGTYLHCHQYLYRSCTTVVPHLYRTRSFGLDRRRLHLVTPIVVHTHAKVKHTWCNT